MKISQGMKVVIDLAATTAKTFKNEYLTPEHLLYSLIQVDDALVERLSLDKIQISNQLSDYLTKKIPTTKLKNYQPVETDGLKKVIMASSAMANNSQREEVEVGDFLISIFDHSDYAKYILRSNNIDRVDILEAVSDLQRGEEEISE